MSAQRETHEASDEQDIKHRTGQALSHGLAHGGITHMNTKTLLTFVLLSTACNTATSVGQYPSPQNIEEQHSDTHILVSTHDFRFGKYIEFLAKDRGYVPPIDIECMRMEKNHPQISPYIYIENFFSTNPTREILFEFQITDPDILVGNYPTCDSVIMSKDNYLNITNHLIYIKFSNMSDNTWMRFEVKMDSSYNENHGWSVDLSKINEDFADYQMRVKVIGASFNINIYKNYCEDRSEEFLKIFLEKLGELEVIYENPLTGNLYKPDLTKTSISYNKVPLHSRIADNEKSSIASFKYSNEMFLRCYPPI